MGGLKMAFSYENLAHQSEAVECVLGVFKDCVVQEISEAKNPLLRLDSNTLKANLNAVQEKQNIDKKHQNLQSNIFDISMETGTGKTYTYTKMCLELAKNYALHKFIIIVPSIAIKANTVNFLNSKSAIEHFRNKYDLEIIASEIKQKSKSGKKKSIISNELNAFIENDNKKEVKFLIINSQMLGDNSWLNEELERSLLDEYDNAFEALSAINPVIIIDEPHKFDKSNKAWSKIVGESKDLKNAKNSKKDSKKAKNSKNTQDSSEQKNLAINPQLIFRYGATFKDFDNLVYKLDTIKSMNDNLIKGITVHITEASGNEKLEFIEFVGIDSENAKFIKKVQGQKEPLQSLNLGVGQNFGVFDSNLAFLNIENINFRKQEIDLSSGETMHKNEKIPINNYLPQAQSQMLESALKKHFELESSLLNANSKIKPLSLFFIEDIESYRNEDENKAYLKQEFERIAQNLMRENLKTASGFYKEYLQKSLENIEGISGGYFSKDNSNKNEAIENEVNEILNDKERLLSLENTRRFIFSKWTLKEGWDNPNIFVICKLRSSGSEISKIQEVGRGLRLPVNEYGNRLTHDENNEEFRLNYFVNDSERDFASRLVGEINAECGIADENNTKEWSDLDKKTIEKICKLSGLDEYDLQGELIKEAIIDKKLKFLENGFNNLKAKYPSVFDSNALKEGKITTSDKKPKRATIRSDKYKALKALWEKLNQKVILEYKVANEGEFYALLKAFLREFKQNAVESKIKQRELRVKAQDSKANVSEVLSVSSSDLEYSALSQKAFISKASEALLANPSTLKRAILELEFSENLFNARNIRVMREEFNDFLCERALSGLKVGFVEISSFTHPTAFTSENGEAKKSIESANLGTERESGEAQEAYLFDEIFYDSEIEKENILENIENIEVFCKIPKNTINIPIAGNKHYTPDFAYILKLKNSDKKQICCIIESKGKDSKDLGKTEQTKIEFAKEIFNKSEIFKDSEIDIKFNAQFDGEKITSVLENL